MDIQHNIRKPHLFTRASVVAVMVLIAVLLLAGTPTDGLALAQATPAATQPPITLPAPTCTAPAKITTALTEGPFYKANTPERWSLIEPGTKGTKIIVTGYVLGTD